SVPKIAVVNEVIAFKPIAGHHFNLKAPQKCDEIVSQDVMEIRCRFKTVGNHDVLLSICDDKETFCKPEKFKLNVTGPKNFKSSKIKSTRDSMVYVPKGERAAPPGFLQNHPEGAINRAKKQKKLLYIYFSTQWCPYCNMFEEYVFND